MNFHIKIFRKFGVELTAYEGIVMKSNADIILVI